MPFVPKNTKQKVEASYKTLYLSKKLIEEIEKIAQENNTSFNNVVVSMIEHNIMSFSDRSVTNG